MDDVAVECGATPFLPRPFTREYRTVQQIVSKVDAIKKCYTIGGGDVPDGFQPFESLYWEDGADAQFLIPAE